jgi:LCP family protein required for cell wall assembly
MFEQLDDTEGFAPGDAFFAGTMRRWATLRRRRATARAAGGVLCLAVATPAFLGVTHRTHRSGGIGHVDATVADGTTEESSTVAGTALRDTTPETGPDETFPPADPAATNFLIVGADNHACVDPGSPYAKSFANDPSSGERSDTIMVVRLDAQSGHVAVLSFPRDLWVKIPGNGTGRINAAYRRDDPQLLIDTLFSEFGVPVDHFIQLDFCAFKKFVDAVGGVAVPMPSAVRDTSTGLDIAQPGCTTFSGDEALAYVRSRHFEYMDAAGAWHQDPSADLGRIARQQDFVRRVLAQASSTGILNPRAVSALYGAYRDDLVIDSELTIAKVLEFVGTLSTVSPADIHGYQIEATGRIIAGSSVLVWDKNSPSMNTILDIFRGLPPASNTTSAPSSADTAPRSNTPASAIVPDSSIEC